MERVIKFIDRAVVARVRECRHGRMESEGRGRQAVWSAFLVGKGT